MNNTRDDKILKAFGAHVRKLRKARKWTLKDLAFEADVELSQIHRIEKGINNPTLTTILLIAEALNIPQSELINFKY